MYKNFNSNLNYLPRIINLIVALFSIAFAIQFINLSKGDLLNHYPYITPDGYEWYTNGVYFFYRLFEENLPQLTVLRPPTFVIFTGLDFLLGSSGYVLGCLFAFSTYYTYYFSLKIIEFSTKTTNPNWALMTALALGVTIAPINYVKVYLLADFLANTLALGSIYFIIKFTNTNLNRFYWLCILFSLLAGLTQTYTLLSYLLISLYICVYCGNVYRLNGILKFSGLFFIPIIGYILLTYLWRNSVSYLMTPENFTLLKFTTRNIEFYKVVWPVFIWVPCLIIIIRSAIIYRPFEIIHTLTIPLFITALLLMTLSFFYQWQESRFTYYVWPWLLILSLQLISRFKSLLLFTSLALIISSFIVPKNYWEPKPKEIVLSTKNWIQQYFSAVPIDRKLIKCEPGCPNNTWMADQNHHGTGKTLSIYLQLLDK